MPHFDRLRSGFCDDENFNVIMAMVYSDILDFHQRAYKFFRRKGRSAASAAHLREAWMLMRSLL
jgi:hypothetical protein